MGGWEGGAGGGEGNGFGEGHLSLLSVGDDDVVGAVELLWSVVDSGSERLR